MLTLETRRTHGCPLSSDEQGKEQTDIHNGTRGQNIASGNIKNTGKMNGPMGNLGVDFAKADVVKAAGSHKILIPNVTQN